MKGGICGAVGGRGATSGCDVTPVIVRGSSKAHGSSRSSDTLQGYHGERSDSAGSDPHLSTGLAPTVFAKGFVDPSDEHGVLDLPGAFRR